MKHKNIIVAAIMIFVATFSAQAQKTVLDYYVRVNPKNICVVPEDTYYRLQEMHIGSWKLPEGNRYYVVVNAKNANADNIKQIKHERAVKMSSSVMFFVTKEEFKKINDGYGIGGRYDKNAYAVFRHGNNSLKLEVSGLHNLSYGRWGGNLKAYWFHYGWIYGIDANVECKLLSGETYDGLPLIERLKPKHAYYGMFGGRLTPPSWPVHLELLGGVGISTQDMLVGAGGKLVETLTGEYNFVYPTPRHMLAAFAEARVVVPLGPRFEAIAAFRCDHRPYEGDYTDVDIETDFKLSEKPIKVVYQSAEKFITENMPPYKKFNMNLHVGVSFWF